MGWGDSSEEPDDLDELARCLKRVAALVREKGDGLVSAVDIRVDKGGVSVKVEGGAGRKVPNDPEKAAWAIRAALAGNAEAMEARKRAEHAALPPSARNVMETVRRSAVMDRVKALLRVAALDAGNGDGGEARRAVTHAIFDAGIAALRADPSRKAGEAYLDGGIDSLTVSEDRHQAVRALAAGQSRREALRHVMEVGYLELAATGANPLVPREAEPRKPSPRAALKPLPRRRVRKAAAV